VSPSSEHTNDSDPLPSRVRIGLPSISSPSVVLVQFPGCPLREDGVVTITATSGGIAGTAEITVFTPSVLVLANHDDGNTAIIDSFPVYEDHLTIDTMNVASQTPTVAFLRQYDAVLLYEDGLFTNAPNVGDSVAAYFQAGGNVVLGTFYWQDRSDNPEYASAHGWGDLETLDPFTAPEGSEYREDHLDVSSIVAHPIMAGVDSLWVDGYHGGVAAPAGLARRWRDHRREPARREISRGQYQRANPADVRYPRGSRSGSLLLPWTSGICGTGD
jgi:hypothetical protein